MNNESGRSMVEMLGVLAIIGVLSIGGIAGYTLAMRRYKANEAVNLMSLAAIYAMTTNGGVGQETVFTTANLPTTLGVGDYSGNMKSLKSSAAGVVETTFDDQKVCGLVNDILGTSRVTTNCEAEGANYKLIASMGEANSAS